MTTEQFQVPHQACQAEALRVIATMAVYEDGADLDELLGIIDGVRAVAVAALRSQARDIETRLTALEADSHPPVDFAALFEDVNRRLDGLERKFRVDPIVTGSDYLAILDASEARKRAETSSGGPA